MAVDIGTAIIDEQFVPWNRDDAFDVALLRITRVIEDHKRRRMNIPRK